MATRALTDAAADLVELPGGRFRMGSDRFYPEERPAREVEVAPFAIMRAPVTNRQFAAFVRATGHVTQAERPLDPAAFPGVDPARLKPGALVFRPLRAVPAVYDHRLWWSYKPGAHWRRPEGAGTVFAGRLEHPVVCVAHDDAKAYAAWAGLRLPTEAEWEFAAGGELGEADFAWGDDFTPGGRRIVLTTPVGSFPANAKGLHDMIGNVWEWTADPYADAAATGCCGSDGVAPSFVVKGGSALCSPDYCARYRPAARQPQASDTSTVHIGFRCAK